MTLDTRLIVPHVASASVAARNRAAMLAVDNCLAALRGETPLCANPRF